MKKDLTLLQSLIRAVLIGLGLGLLFLLLWFVFDIFIAIAALINGAALAAATASVRAVIPVVKLHRTGLRTEGVMTGTTAFARQVSAVIRYSVDGKEYDCELYNRIFWKPGKTFTVLYAPEHPENSCIYKKSLYYGIQGAAVFCIISVAALIATLLMFLTSSYTFDPASMFDFA